MRSEITQKLRELDMSSIRALREGNETRIAALETEAADLRAALALAKF